ncbi:MAG TPA: VWA domain-containing protein [Acidobacteriaceae bacterium]|nr:VWA domain-containing protein [Acidobacteriaceae bacterium]
MGGLVVLSGFAQQIGENTAGGDQTYSMRVTSHLVIEPVTVTDKQGNPITGLTAKDFTITEDGAPQEIKIFEYQDLPVSETKPPAPYTPQKVTIYNHLARTQIAPEPPGSNTRYRNHRMLALYFDMSAMGPPEQLRALDAAENFLKTQMQPEDLVSILRYDGGAVDVLQDFTADRDRLISILETLVVGEGQGFAEVDSDSSASDTGAAFGQDDSEFNIFNTDRQLSALQTAAKMLGNLSEKKALVYFASGIQLNGLDNQAQLHATIDDAIRSGVSFWPVDARGLVAEGPLGDATRGSQGSSAMYTGAAAQAMRTNFNQSQDTLYSLASDTGGKALLDSNDLGRGIVQAEKAMSSYYILGYYSTNMTKDGKFRRVKVTLNGHPEAKLDFKEGYYADKVWGKFNDADKERQLEDALMQTDPWTDLTVAMEVDYFQLNHAEYFVPIIVKIPGRELALAKKGGAEKTSLEFIGEIKDDYGGITVNNLRDKIDRKLSGETANQLAKEPLEYDFGFTELPGKFTIKFLVRDDETGRMGTFQTDFVIPNLNKEVQHLPISSVVLSSERQDLKTAIFNAVKTKDEAANPLVQNGLEMIPSVTRVFRKDQTMYVYLQAYEENASPIRPLISYVSFYDDKGKVLETQPLKMTQAMTSSVNPVPITFSIPLGQLPAGNYKCQVSVLDPGTQKAAFWQAPVVILP